MRFSVFHPGTQHSWQTATALQQLGRLEWYATSIFYNPDRFPYNLEKVVPARLAQRLHAEFRRFSHPGLDPALVRTVGLAEWVERIASRAGLDGLARTIDRYGNRRFVHAISKDILSDRPFGVWGYSSSSLSTFRVAKQAGRTCILDRTNGDFRIYNAMMETLMADYGHWFAEHERKVPDSQIADQQAEYEIADRIVVGSPFAARTIADATGDPAIVAKTQILNYCFDDALFSTLPPPKPVPADRPVRFLFLGLLIPRKGIQHVLEAIERIPPEAAELTIVGNMMIPDEVFARFHDRVRYIPTVARSDVPAIMAAHDVFLLPSYFEGAGITLYEALAAGCALIHSRHCANAATPDTGIVLDTISTESLYEAMMQLIDNRDLLNHFRAHAQAEAQNYTFTRYRDNIAALLDRMAV